jgi:hypothetical protein
MLLIKKIIKGTQIDKIERKSYIETQWNISLDKAPTRVIGKLKNMMIRTEFFMSHSCIKLDFKYHQSSQKKIRLECDVDLWYSRFSSAPEMYITEAAN